MPQAPAARRPAALPADDAVPLSPAALRLALRHARRARDLVRLGRARAPRSRRRRTTGCSSWRARPPTCRRCWSSCPRSARPSAASTGVDLARAALRRIRDRISSPVSYRDSQRLGCDDARRGRGASSATGRRATAGRAQRRPVHAEGRSPRASRACRRRGAASARRDGVEMTKKDVFAPRVLPLRARRVRGGRPPAGARALSFRIRPRPAAA